MQKKDFKQINYIDKVIKNRNINNEYSVKGTVTLDISRPHLYRFYACWFLIFIGNLWKMRVVTVQFIVSFKLACIAHCTNFEYFFNNNSCSLRYKHFKDAKDIIKCDRMRQLNPLCNRSIVVKYFELKPYAFDNKSDVTGLLPGRFTVFAKLQAIVSN